MQINNQQSLNDSSEDLEFEGQNIFTEEQFSYDHTKQYSADQSPPSETK